MDDCDCVLKTCRPEYNEGRRCWRSGFLVPEGYFSDVARNLSPCVAGAGDKGSRAIAVKEGATPSAPDQPDQPEAKP